MSAPFPPRPERTSPVIPGLIGVAVGVLLTGLLLPFVVHDRGGAQASGGELTVAGAGGRTTASSLDASGAAVAGTAGSGVDAGPSTTLTATLRAAANASAPGARGATPAPTVQAAATPGSVVAGKVTGPPIKVGFTLFQVSGAAGIGFVINVDPKQEQQTYQAYVDYVNSTDGINGRKIEPVYSTYDLLDQNSQNASCLALTQDAKVSAVIGGYNFTSADSCVVDQNRTLMFNNNSFTADELYSTGRHVSLFPQANRMMTALAVRLAQDGHLRGKKVGILDDLGGDPDRSVLADLTSAVKANGGEVVRQSVLSADLATGSSQIPVEVSQMHAAGAETVLLIAFGVYNTQFAQEADSQKWTPFYGATDWQAMYTNVATQNMPASFQGASVTTTRTNEERVGMPEPPQAVQCREIYERMTGSKLDVRGSDSYGLAITNCDSVLVFAAVARAAGSELTAASFVAGAQRMGSIPEARWGGGAFGPGKLDLNDQYRISRYSSDCKCWKPATPFSGA